MKRWLISYKIPAEKLRPLLLEISAELLDMDRPHVTQAMRRVLWRNGYSW